MPKMRRPPGYTGSGAEVMIGGPLTTVGPSAVPLPEMQRYLRQVMQSVLPDVMKTGSFRLPWVAADEVADVPKYVDMLTKMSTKQPMAKVPGGGGSDAAPLEKLLDKLVDYFSSSQFDPLK